MKKMEFAIIRAKREAIKKSKIISKAIIMNKSPNLKKNIGEEKLKRKNLFKKKISLS